MTLASSLAQGIAAFLLPLKPVCEPIRPDGLDGLDARTRRHAEAAYRLLSHCDWYYERLAVIDFQHTSASRLRACTRKQEEIFAAMTCLGALAARGLVGRELASAIWSCLSPHDVPEPSWFLPAKERSADWEMGRLHDGADRQDEIADARAKRRHGLEQHPVNVHGLVARLLAVAADRRRTDEGRGRAWGCLLEAHNLSAGKVP